MREPGAADDEVFIVELERFEGPLDLLLHLIREQDIDILDIPIARITEQFLRAIEGIQTRGLDRAGEFLELAATLVRIKAQMLLPRHADDDGDLEDPRAELVRRLLEYEHFRDAADRLEVAESVRSRQYGRGYVPPPPALDPSDLDLEVDWGEVWDALYELLARTRPAEMHRVIGRVITLEEKIEVILDALRSLTRVEFAELLRQNPGRPHAVATLLASLELARRRELAMRQRKPFAPLWLYRRTDPEAARAENHEDDADH
jgi:segregation and condensation protein A